MGKNQKSSGGLGQALIRQRAQSTRLPGRMYGAERPLESITDVKDLDEVMEQAERAGRVFSALHPLPELLLDQENAEGEILSPYDREQQRHAEEAIYQASLTVPRRPAWEVGMTAEQLDIQERQAFLTWRRGLARLEENEKLVITPFEKNIDIWRQLWRVLERSDLVIMVVDCRNPLFYRCPDLEAYVQEMDSNKRTMLLLNKADLLPAPLRKIWADCFRTQGISFLFWSAKAATAALEGKLENLGLDVPADDKDVEILGREDLLIRLQAEAEMIASTRKDAANAAFAHHLGKEDSGHVQDGVLRPESSSRVTHGATTSDGDSRRVVVGFVGYPNVGKSSTINALVGGKKTGVTSTPGKTKHFQTLIINEKLMLCDCPGLVFPSFSSSRSEMVASGVLPIDRITDQRGPIEIVAQRVTRETLEKVYGLRLPAPKPYERQDRPPSASELLRAYALSRGLVASSGLPDETRAARQILKDYSNGKLFHCCLPPEEGTNGIGHVDQIAPSGTGSGNDTDSEDETRSGASVSGEEDSIGHDNGESDDDIVELESVSGIRSRRLDVSAGSAKLLGLQPEASEHALQGIFHDIDNVGNTFGGSAGSRSQQRVKAATSHKMHRKAPRKKDRSWRVQNDGSDGMSLVRGVQMPVSHGAAPLQHAVM